MGKEKVTLTLDAGQLEDLRRIAGARSLSAAVDTAVAAYLARLRHLASVDEWLAELEREHGPIPSETLEWAAGLVEEWDESPPASGLRAGWCCYSPAQQVRLSRMRALFVGRAD